jgi:hypothetical protein
MKDILQILTFIFLLQLSTISCKKAYSPPATNINYKYLVVNGTILNSPDSPTVITVSRTVQLTDSTTASSPEPGATVSIQGKNGEAYPLRETTGGRYISTPLILNYTEQYQLKITTSNGSRYASDFVPVLKTPAIDSVTWQQENGVGLYVSTSDPSNNIKYYRWDYLETYQYQSKFDRTIAEKNGLIYFVDSTNQTYNCWRNDNANNILIASTAALNNSVVVGAPLTTILQNSVKLAVRYSILVKQYAITADAFQYLDVLKKNTETLGSIFDAQPTQLSGNVHCITNPQEIVIGYVMASSAEQQRIFISQTQLSRWNYVYDGPSCDEVVITQNTGNFLSYNYADTSFAPYYFISPNLLDLAKKPCVDCTTKGGSTVKPAFW